MRPLIWAGGALEDWWGTKKREALRRTSDRGEGGAGCAGVGLGKG